MYWEPYRPMSLLNSEYKVFAKVLSGWLNQVRGTLLYGDKKGFLRGRILHELMHALIGSIDLTTTFKFPLAVLKLDASKAFDKVNWKYLQRVLKQGNLGEIFCRVEHLI